MSSSSESISWRAAAPHAAATLLTAIGSATVPYFVRSTPVVIGASLVTAIALGALLGVYSSFSTVRAAKGTVQDFRAQVQDDMFSSAMCFGALAVIGCLFVGIFKGRGMR